MISCTFLEPPPPPPFLFFRTTETLEGKIDETQVQG